MLLILCRKEMFGDVDFAWNLLEEEIKIEIN
jgi:hypothetical protein